MIGQGLRIGQRNIFHFLIINYAKYMYVSIYSLGLFESDSICQTNNHATATVSEVSISMFSMFGVAGSLLVVICPFCASATTSI